MTSFEEALSTIQKLENKLNVMEMKRLERLMPALEKAKLRFNKVHAQTQITIAKINKRKKAFELLGNACQVCGSTNKLTIRCRMPEYLLFKPKEKYDKVIEEPSSFTILCKHCQMEVIKLEKSLSRFETLRYLPFMRSKAKRLVSKYITSN